VGDELIVGGGAGDVEGREQPETLVGTAGPHELLAQRRRGTLRRRRLVSLLRSGGLRRVGVAVGTGSGRRTHGDLGRVGEIGWIMDWVGVGRLAETRGDEETPQIFFACAWGPRWWAATQSISPTWQTCCVSNLFCFYLFIRTVSCFHIKSEPSIPNLFYS
jgi:hypothetical protein